MINWEEEVLDCPFHGWLCTKCRLSVRVALKNASNRTQIGILRGRYKLSDKEIEKILKVEIKKIVPEYVMGTTDNPIFIMS